MGGQFYAGSVCTLTMESWNELEAYALWSHEKTGKWMNTLIHFCWTCCRGAKTLQTAVCTRINSDDIYGKRSTRQALGKLEFWQTFLSVTDTLELFATVLWSRTYDHHIVQEQRTISRKRVEILPNRVVKPSTCENKIHFYRSGQTSFYYNIH